MVKNSSHDPLKMTPEELEEISREMAVLKAELAKLEIQLGSSQEHTEDLENARELAHTINNRLSVLHITIQLYQQNQKKHSGLDFEQILKAKSKS